jgi:hypothetical protein
LLAATGPLSILRALPGYGGTRLLEEIEVAQAPARSLYLASAGAEPLGALRRAFSRSVVTGLDATNHSSDSDRLALWRLMSGEGIALAAAADLIVGWTARARGSMGAVLIDDVMEIDDPSLEAVAVALRRCNDLRCFARFESDDPLPTSLASFAVSQEIALEPLSRGSAAELLSSLSSAALSLHLAKRLALRGLCLPLGIVEAVFDGVVRGEIALTDDPTPARAPSEDRTRRQPSEWIARRFDLLPARARRALRATAVLGLEVSSEILVELLTATGADGSSELMHELGTAGWLRIHPDGSYALASRTHREVILESMGDDERAIVHASASFVVEKLGGSLAAAEAARHAAMGGDQARAVKLALAAARASHALGLTAATEALLSFADSDASALTAPAQPVLRVDSWIDALRASGVRDGAAGRLEAIAQLAEGRTREAVAQLKEGVRKADKAAPAARSRAWLAYAIGLAVAGRAGDALFAGLEALASARESGESQGEKACARFLARLSRGAGHPDVAAAWETLKDKPEETKEKD